jgi:hypothetical protein
MDVNCQSHAEFTFPPGKESQVSNGYEAGTAAELVRRKNSLPVPAGNGTRCPACSLSHYSD